MNSTALLSDPKRLLLDLAQEHSVPALLQLIVTRLTESNQVALARIWLSHPTPTCVGCPTVDVCRTQSQCLHLVASGGSSVASSGVEWTDTDGAFRRIAFGARKVGRIALTGRPLEELELTEPYPEWIARPEWVRAEGIRGFAGQPMIHRGHWRMAALCFSTKLAKSRSNSKQSFCASSRKVTWSASGKSGLGKSMYAWSRRRTAICGAKWKRADSARTCSTGSACSQ